MIYSSFAGRYRSFKRLVEKTARALKGVKFDTIVVRGMSGATVGPSVALRLGKDWALVRKNGDSTHSYRKIEGKVGRRYVIIDDFPASGATVRTIVKEINKRFTDIDEKCVGVYFYDLGYRPGKKARADLSKIVGGLTILN